MLFCYYIDVSSLKLKYESFDSIYHDSKLLFVTYKIFCLEKDSYLKLFFFIELIQFSSVLESSSSLELDFYLLILSN